MLGPAHAFQRKDPDFPNSEKNLKKSKAQLQRAFQGMVFMLLQLKKHARQARLKPTFGDSPTESDFKGIMTGLHVFLALVTVALVGVLVGRSSVSHTEQKELAAELRGTRRVL
eukprot:g16618.t1